MSFVFFFQAEDGIRDTSVTGVQTCALPISLDWAALDCPARDQGGEPTGRSRIYLGSDGVMVPHVTQEEKQTRSEERRVGKECRSRWSPDHEKKKRWNDKAR